MKMTLLMVIAMPLFALPKPYIVPSDGAPTNFNYSRSICGKDDMVKMINQSSDLQTMGTPIGIWKVSVDGGTGMCTGTLIDKDLFLTAQHCEGACSSITVTFGYLQDSRQETFRCKEIIEKGDGTLENDYMVVRLEGNPGVQYGWYDISKQSLSPKQPLLIIHHPSGLPMRASIKDCVVKEQSSTFLHHRCDTLPGTSGSAILLPDFQTLRNTRIVGVHTLGGCSDDNGTFNSGPAIKHLIEVSPLLKSMAKD